MHAVDELVQSEKFGFGKVIAQTANRVTVAFFADNTTMDFVYPDGFAGELRFAEPFAQREIEYEMRAQGARANASDASDRFDF